ncbi:MAG: hypothetical protein EOM34_14225 [Clostridia bacterium]|nr:hypothetical protein [Clostridia bacterium]
MRNILICVDSVFQYIIAASLRNTIYKEDKVDLIIYNSFGNAASLYRESNNLDYYRKVFLADTPLTFCGKKYAFKEKLPKYFIYLASLIAPKNTCRSILNEEFDCKYDHMIFNGDGALPECIFNSCLKDNPKLICYRIEDGYFSYMKIFGKEKGRARVLFESTMHHMFRTKNIRNYIRGYYLSEPDLKQVEYPYPAIRISKFSRDNIELIKFLNKVFDYDPSNNREFDGKVIYFEDGASFFDGSDEEISIMQEIIKTIPSKDILVKRHPRRIEDRFAPMGISCCTVNSVPWELIQLNGHFDGQTLISSCSGTLYNSDIYFGDKCKKIFTYRMMKNPPFITKEEHFEDFLTKFREVFGATSILTPNSNSEFVSVIK